MVNRWLKPLLALQLAVFFISPTPAGATVCGKVVLGYYPDWDSGYDWDDVQYENLTHIAHAFVLPSYPQNQPWNADGSLKLNTPAADANMINAAHANGVRVLVSFGGAQIWPESFGVLGNAISYICNDAGRRATLVSALVALVQARSYDGVDIDWEYPDGYAPYTTSLIDRANMTAFSNELRAALDGAGVNFFGEPYEMAYVVSPGMSSFAWYESWNLKNIYDHIGIMTYNYHGNGWPGDAGHNSPLYGPSCCLHSQCASTDMGNWNTVAGLPKDKMLLGVPFYGFRYRGATTCGDYGATIISAYDNRQIYGWGGYVDNWDAVALAPYKTRLNEWVSYSDSKSVTEKCNYVIADGYGGIIIWNIGGDFYGGTQECLEAAGLAFACGTPTPTSTVSATSTISPTSSATATYTESVTHTLSFTESASATGTVTPTATLTVTPTATQSASHTLSATGTPSSSHTPSATVSASYTVSETGSPLPSRTATVTVTPAESDLVDIEFYPDPWYGQEGAVITFLLTQPADKVAVKVYTTSYRRVCETWIETPPGGEYVKLEFDDSWCRGLANGTYLYVVEVYEGKVIVGRKIGKFVVLR